tara:strand:+ start:713 stop:2149 length:1437 start_codon:yes stop_codon:yes gene_type:complete
MAFDKFKKFKFTARTASAGTSFKPYYEVIHKELRTGAKSISQGGFFNYDRVKANPEKYHIEEDTTTGEIAIYPTPTEYREFMHEFIGNGSIKRSNLPDAVTSSISASFFRKIGQAVTNLPAGERPAILSSRTALPPTASFTYKRMPGILNPGKLIISNTSTNVTNTFFKFSNEWPPLRTGNSLIPGQRGQHRFTSGSSKTTHLTRSFQKESFFYSQDEIIPEFSFKFIQPTGSTAVFTANHKQAFENGIVCYATTASITTSADYGVVASSSVNFTGSWLLTTGSRFTGTSQFPQYQVPYNGINGTDGLYNRNSIKGLVSGEGYNYVSSQPAAGDLSYLPIKYYVYYSSSQAVQSGVYKYNSSSAAAASSSGTNTTLYYASSSLGKGPSGSYTGSFVGNNTKMKSGSHLWLDANLTTPASSGFYAIPGTTTVLGAHLGYSSITALGGLALGVSSSLTGSSVPVGKIEEIVPRWTSKSIH